MKQYEQILDKIAPVFYKTIQYDDYFDNYLYIVDSYLDHVEMPNEYSYVELPRKNVFYYFHIIPDEYHIISENTTSGQRIILTKDNKQTEHYPFSLDEVIINMIINNFSFEKERIDAPYIAYNKSFKTLFIALVGQDMYDTLRANIR